MDGVKLVVFDFAGTTVDHGCLAPLQAFITLFAERGVPVSAAQARTPMGLDKGDHIRAMLRDPDVARLWRQTHGRDSTEADFHSLYERFVILQLEVIDRYSDIVPHLLETVAELRSRGIRVGATTGYFKEAADRVVASARAQGYEPEYTCCAQEVSAGRPAPWMLFRVMERLNVYPPAAVVKIGDTVPDILEGRSAGAWSVGVLRASSEMGLSQAEWDRLPATERGDRLASAARKLLGAGAHAVMETLADVPALITEINGRLRHGEKP